jgi:NADH dehydrogenase
MEKMNPHVVVLGAGFGGLTFCQTFNHRAARITLFDRQNHHLFQPLLYQVATAGLSAPKIAQPIRSILSDRPNVTVLLDHVTGFDLAAKTVRLEESTLTYDYLVLALGGQTSYFGHPEWEQFAPGLKSLDDAMGIRRRVLLAFEKAENANHPAGQERWMTIVVVGGGPTGVELAGAIAELTRTVLQKDFKRIDPSQARVVMIEAGPRVLAQFSPKLSASAERQLKALGVEVRTATKVKSIGRGRVDLESGEIIVAENIIWAAGVSASPLTQTLGVELDRAGRVKVSPDLSLPGHPEVFAIGDMALVLGEDGQPVPGVSPAAMQMARHVARLIENELLLSGRSPRWPFQYRNKGTMAMIGRSAAVAKMGRFEFSGFPAWLAWLGVHLIFLIGFRNKMAVLLQWAYAYCTYKRGARIITGLADNTEP